MGPGLRRDDNFKKRSPPATVLIARGDIPFVAGYRPAAYRRAGVVAAPNPLTGVADFPPAGRGLRSASRQTISQCAPPAAAAAVDRDDRPGRVGRAVGGEEGG